MSTELSAFSASSNIAPCLRKIVIYLHSRFFFAFFPRENNKMFSSHLSQHTSKAQAQAENLLKWILGSERRRRRVEESLKVSTNPSTYGTASSNFLKFNFALKLSIEFHNRLFPSPYFTNLSTALDESRIKLLFCVC